MLHQRQWWLEEDEQSLAAAVVSAADSVEMDTAYRYERMLEIACLYGDVNVWSSAAYVRQVGPRITHNIIANAVDALVSEVTQTQPRPMAVTIGGDWYERQRARKLTAYWDAKWQEVGMRALGPQVLRDGILFGLGVARPYIERDRVKIERIWPGHVRIDDRACVDVMPRTLYIARPFDRHQLIGLYPEHEEAIRGAPAPETRWDYSDPTADVVEVVEAWHLPSTDPDEDDEHDGKHVIAVQTALLYEEPWVHDRYPLAFMRAVLPQRGFWGESLAWRGAPYQFERNKIARRIQEAMHLVAVPRIFVQRQSGIVKSKLNNEIGAIIEHDGPAPQFLTPPAMASDVYQYMRDLEQGIFSVMGVSQMSAQSLKPAGLNSGKAIRLYNDVQSRRFVNTERAYEDFHCNLAMIVTMLERQIAEESPKHEVSYNVDRRAEQAERVPWSEIDLDADRMRIQVFPTSALPTTPAARLQALEEMRAEGSIDNQAFYELVDDPDLESIRKRVTAPSEIIRKRLDKIVETGDYLPPEPYMDLNLALSSAAVSIQEAELEDVPEERVELLRLFLVETQALVQRSQMPPEAPPAGPMGAAPAAPGAEVAPPMNGAAPPVAAPDGTPAPMN